MFHHSKLGRFGDNLREWADLDGYVAEEGDNPEDFSWPHEDFTKDFDEYGNGYDGCADEMWSNHVAECVEVTRVNASLIRTWRIAECVVPAGGSVRAPRFWSITAD
jgi:hypothetical protein